MPKPTGTTAKDRLTAAAKATAPVVTRVDLSARATPTYKSGSSGNTGKQPAAESAPSSAAKAVAENAGGYRGSGSGDGGSSGGSGGGRNEAPDNVGRSGLVNQKLGGRGQESSSGQRAAIRQSRAGLLLGASDSAARRYENRQQAKDFLEAIPASVQRGADAVQTGVTGVLDMFLGQPLQALGWENNPISEWNELAQREAAGNAAKWDERIGNSGAQLLADVGSQVVAAVPDAVLAMYTGGASAGARGLQAASAARQAANAARGAGKAAQAMQAAATGAGAMVRNPSYWASFARTAGSNFNEARAQGADSAKATAYATINGLIGALVEVGGGGIQSLPGELRTNPGQLRAWVDSMIDEGKEEIVQGAIDRLAQNVILQADRPLASLTNEDAVISLTGALREGAMGAAVGGILGGGQILLNNAANGARTQTQREVDAVDAFLEAAGVSTRQPGAEVAPESVPTQGAAQSPVSGFDVQTSTDTANGINADTAQQSAQTAETGSAVVNENGLVALTERERQNLSSGSRNKILSTISDAVSFVRNALTNRNSTDRGYMGKIPDSIAARVRNQTGVDITGYNAVLPSDAVRHIFRNHGNAQREASRGQIAVSPESVAQIATVLSSPDNVRLSDQTDSRGRRMLLFEKAIGNLYVTAQAVTDGTKSLSTDTLYIRKRNSQDTGYNAENNSPVHNAQSVPPQSSYRGAPASGLQSPTAHDGAIPVNNIPDSGQNVNPASGLAGSMTDEQLRAEQQKNAEDIDSVQLFLDAAARGESTAVNTNPTEHTPAEQRVIEDYQNAVDQGVVGFVNRVQTLVNPDYRNRVRHTVSTVSPAEAAAVEQLTGVDPTGFSNILTGGAVDHITARHGALGEQDRSMADVNDLARIGYVIDNFDNAELLLNDDGTPNTSNVWHNSDNSPALRVRFSKRIDGTYYVVEAVPDSRARVMAIESAYMQKNNDRASTGAVLNMAQNAPQVTPQTPQRANAYSINTSIPGSRQNVNPESSTGAAPRGFDRFSAALERYGEMPERGTGARETSIPRAMDDDTVVPRTVQTFANAAASPETTYTDITRLLEQGNFNRAVITDRASLGRAERTIEYKGFQQALTDWTATVRRGRVSKDTTTLGLTLYNNAINSGDTRTGIQILTDIVDNARTAAQATQAMSILNKLTPEGRLYGIQRSIANLQDELVSKYGDLAPELHIDESLAGDYINATDEQTRFEILDQIYQSIANQVPQTAYDRINAWRYFSMLANPRTHARNLLGNTAMAGLTAIRNRISSGLQSGFVKNRNQRTRETISRSDSVYDEARYQVGLQEYRRINDMLGDAGKYTNELNRIRRHMRAPFKGALGKAVDFASDTLEAEDLFFSRRAYASSLAQFLKARNISAEDYVSGAAGQEVIAEAQAHAIREAQRLTFRDFNTFSDFVQRLANLGGDSKVGRTWQTVVGANLPFTRTPANILVRGVEYSPIGLMRGIYNLSVNVKRGNMTAGEAIDQLSSGLVGTALLGLGVLLASQGVITGGGSDDEEQRAFDELQGFQPYALQIGGHSYTLDWLAPAALPFFTGAEIWNQAAGHGSRDEDTSALEAVLQGIGHMADPMLEMSMLSGISGLLDSVAYYQGGNSLWPILATSVTNYIGQFVPSVLGAIERTAEDTRQSSYTDTDSVVPDDLQYALSQVMNRLPGEYNQVDYIDAWGRTESTGGVFERAATNFVSPGYHSALSTSEVEAELQRVYDATGGEYNVFPQRATMGNTTINGERLTPEQYTEYATMLGQTRLAEVSALQATDAYKAMSDVEKARAILEVYDYATQTAKHAIDPSYEVDSRYEKAAEYGNAAEYLAFDRAWATVNDTKGTDTTAFEAVMQDYGNMSAEQQDAVKTFLGENSRFDDVVEAYQDGVSPADWFVAYDKYRELNDNSELHADEQATAFAHWAQTETGYSAQQRELLQEQFGFYDMTRGDTDRYDTLQQAGLSADKAVAVYDAVSTLVPASGKTKVSDQQKYEAIVGLDGLTEMEKVAALTEYEGASEGDRLKFQTAYNYGVSPELYVDMLALKDEGYGDADESGSYKQAEAKTLVDHMLDTYDEMTNSEAAVLWAMLCTSSKRSNPYGDVYYGSMDWERG